MLLQEATGLRVRKKRSGVLTLLFHLTPNEKGLPLNLLDPADVPGPAPNASRGPDSEQFSPSLCPVPTTRLRSGRTLPCSVRLQDAATLSQEQRKLRDRSSRVDRLDQCSMELSQKEKVDARTGPPRTSEMVMDNVILRVTSPI